MDLSSWPRAHTSAWDDWQQHNGTMDLCLFSLNIDLSLLSFWMGVACLQLQQAIFLIFRLIKTKPTRTYHDIFYPKTILRALPSDGKTSEGNKTARPFPVSVMPPSGWAAPRSTRALVRDATHLTLLHISSSYFIISHESSQCLMIFAIGYCGSTRHVGGGASDSSAVRHSPCSPKGSMTKG